MPSQDKDRLGMIAWIYFIGSVIVFTVTAAGFKAPDYVYTLFSPAKLGDLVYQRLPLSSPNKL